MAYLKPYGWMTAGVYTAMVIINLINILQPQFIRRIIDDGIFTGNLATLSWSVAALLGITIIKGITLYFQGTWTEQASQNVAYDLRNQIQTKLNQLSFAFHDRMETGQILSRAIQDVERIRFLTGRAFLRIVESLVLMIGTGAVLVWMDYRLGLMIVLTIPIIAYSGYAYGRKFRPLSVKIQNQLGVLTTRVEQNLLGGQVVKGFAQEDAEIERFTRENEKWFGQSSLAVKMESLNVPLLDLIANLGTVLILWYGGTLVLRGELTLGEMVAFTTYLSQLVRPLRLLGRVIPALAIASSGGERIFHILDDDSIIRENPQAAPAPITRGEVCFDNVAFGYEDNHPVVEEISFSVQPGQVVALLGATGSGKSTIINLITRFYDAQKGSITIDGVNIRDIPLTHLRRQIGIVLQDTRLFAASIRENIAFGKPDASETEIMAAAQEAQAHDFITRMAEGYDSLVGERGVTLSGGQKQRIAIARTLLTNPRILILDDATSSVDTQTEQMIQEALQRLMTGKTTFIIAHRLSTVRRADMILLLENGRISARGTHAQLMHSSPLYREVYLHQLRPEERTGQPRPGWEVQS